MDRKIIDYIVIEYAQRASELAKEVNSYLEEGYQPLGGPVQQKDWLMQAMVKYEEDPYTRMQNVLNSDPEYKRKQIAECNRIFDEIHKAKETPNGS